MRRKVAVYILTVVLFIMTLSSASYAHPPIKVFLNGEEIVFDSQPIIHNDRTLVPVRFIVEKMGADVEWDGDTRTVTITYKGKVIKLQIDNQTTYVNGVKYVLDTVPIIREDRTLVPLRFLSENFGCLVEWDGENYYVYITKAKINIVTDKNQIKVGDTFDVVFNIEEVYDLYSYQISGAFDNTKLEIVEIKPSDYIGGMIFKNEFDNEEGKFTLIKTLLGKVPGVSEKGELARVTFKAKGTGEVKLQFDDKGIVLVNSNTKIIPLEMNNNVITIK